MNKNICGVLILKNNGKKDMLKNLSLITQVGLSIVVPIILGVYLGGWLDKVFKKDMLFSIIFIILGAMAGFMNLLNLADDKKDKRK